MNLTVRRLPDLSDTQLRLLHDLIEDYRNRDERPRESHEIAELYAAQDELRRCLS